MYALNATNVAAIKAARRLTSCDASQYIAGTMSVPASAGTNRIIRGVISTPPGIRRTVGVSSVFAGRDCCGPELRFRPRAIRPASGSDGTVSVLNQTGRPDLIHQYIS